MAILGLPPPRAIIEPSRLSIATLNSGTTLVRVYDPSSRYAPGPRSFRHHGPHKRFDHHRGATTGASAPSEDKERAVYYAAFSLSGSIVEVVGDDRVIDRGSFCIVYSTLRGPIRLLDLRGNAAIRAGVIHGIGQIEQASKTQAWSRYFYETDATYGKTHGLLYANAHNGEDAVLLYERASIAIASAHQTIRRLASLDLEVALLRIADATGFVLI